MKPFPQFTCKSFSRTIEELLTASCCLTKRAIDDLDGHCTFSVQKGVGFWWYLEDRIKHPSNIQQELADV